MSICLTLFSIYARYYKLRLFLLVISDFSLDLFWEAFKTCGRLLPGLIFPAISGFHAVGVTNCNTAINQQCKEECCYQYTEQSKTQHAKTGRYAFGANLHPEESQFITIMGGKIHGERKLSKQTTVCERLQELKQSPATAKEPLPWCRHLYDVIIAVETNVHSEIIDRIYRSLVRLSKL